MLYDFGLMKGTIKEFIDSMDHCYILCSKDKKEFKDFIKENCDRWIEIPFNPSAECLAMFIQWWVNYIINHTKT
jgi:6-pyruvoyltetrahydropterin/6-carboxytetrahydropterin synthase